MNLKNMFKFWGNDVIQFYCHPALEEIIPKPRAAVKNLPEWFKNLEPTCEGEEDQRDPFGNKSMSAKKCLPMLDAMSLGYMIPLAGDLHIRTNHDNSQIQVTNPPGMKLCEFHSAAQLGGNNKLGIKHADALKFINQWIIKTAPGWSTFFIPPVNHFDSPFTCLSGLVDTDVYPKHVNFPAVLTEYDLDIHITAGTPLITAIPIKRNSFPKTPKIIKMSKKEMMEIERIQRTQDLRTHHYTYELRKRD
jgi:hypothetical protein